MDYQNGKIYAIRSWQTDKYYIGSTTQSLSKRLSYHKKDYRAWVAHGLEYITSCEIFKYGDAYIELIENCPCDTKDELHKREGELIRQHITEVVNKRLPGGKTLEEQKAYEKAYNEANKDKRNAYNKVRRNNKKENKEEHRNKMQSLIDKLTKLTADNLPGDLIEINRLWDDLRSLNDENIWSNK